MKTAISLDGKLLEEADQTAKRMGVSRSRLFSLAMEEYIRHRRNRQIIDSLNRVYAGEPDVTVRRVLSGIKTKFRSAIKDAW